MCYVLSGFSTPILHGLCSFGIATRHVMRQYCNNDTTMVKAIKVYCISGNIGRTVNEISILLCCV